MIFKIDFKLIIVKLFNMIYYNDKLHLLYIKYMMYSFNDP